MKRPKKLTRAQKIILSKKGYNAEKYMLKEEGVDTFTIIAKECDEDGHRQTILLPK